MYAITDMLQSDYEVLGDPTGFDAAKLVQENADRHFAILDEHQKIRARCSIWWRDTPTFENSRVGAIGHYAAEDDVCARELLEHACRELKLRRCEYAVGPLDGNTWRRYRFVTERGCASPFFMEPDNPDAWPGHFTGNGFDSIARYVSELNPDFPNRKPQLGKLRDKFAALGIEVEAIDPACSQQDMQDIHALVCEAFADGFLYTSLDFESFARAYRPLIASVDPRLMLVARHEGRIVGFVFAPPDYLQSPDAHNIDTIVIKTVAILPRPEYSGLGRVLIVDMLQNAEAIGYCQAISALMHVRNRSQKISADCAGPMRAYELFARRLSA